MEQLKSRDLRGQQRAARQRQGSMELAESPTSPRRAGHEPLQASAKSDDPVRPDDEELFDGHGYDGIGIICKQS